MIKNIQTLHADVTDANRTADLDVNKVVEELVDLVNSQITKCEHLNQSTTLKVNGFDAKIERIASEFHESDETLQRELLNDIDYVHDVLYADIQNVRTTLSQVQFALKQDIAHLDNTLSNALEQEVSELLTLLNTQRDELQENDARITELIIAKTTQLSVDLHRIIDTHVSDLKEADARLQAQLQADVEALDTRLTQIKDKLSEDIAETNTSLETLRKDVIDYIEQNNQSVAETRSIAEYATTPEEVDQKIRLLNLPKTYEPIGAEDRANDYADRLVSDANLDQYTTEQEVKDIVDAVIAGAVDGDTIIGLANLVEYLNTHGYEAKEMGAAIDVLEGKVEIVEGKPAYGITATQISNWDNEVGAKGQIEQHKGATNAHTKDQVGLGNVDNKSFEEIKTDLTGSISENDAGFVTGSDIYDLVTVLQKNVSSALESAVADAKNYADMHDSDTVYDDSSIRIAVENVETNLQSVETNLQSVENNLETVENNLKTCENQLAELITPLAFEEGPVRSDNNATYTANSKQEITISWKFNKNPQSVSINGQKVADENISTNMSYIWEASNLNKTVTVAAESFLGKIISKTVNVTFTNYVYYWVGGLDVALPTEKDNGITPLENCGKFSSTSGIGNVTKTMGNNEYFYFACPSTYPDPVFSVGPLPGGVDRLDFTLEITDNGTNIPYKIFRSTNPNLGKTTFALS